MAELTERGTGGDDGSDRRISGLGTEVKPGRARTTLEKLIPYRSTVDNPDPAVLRKQIASQDEAEDQLESSQAVARRARDAFKDACDAGTPDQAEASFLAARQAVAELWSYAHLRDRPFRDLLALLDAGIKLIDFQHIEPVQREVFCRAFADLPRSFLDDELVEQHIDRFADHAIDEIVRPISMVKGKRFKVTVEEIE